jgi:TRAP-type uncharacterized transport system substrate-binding protein
MASGRPGKNVAIAAAVLFVVLLVALVLIKPAMPASIDLLTGPPGSAYYELGQQYAEELRRRGLDAEAIATDGAIDNLQRVATASDAVAFAPATLGRDSAVDGVDMSGLVALGSVDFEPMWLFCRATADIERIADLAGKKVATPGPGTNSDTVARRLLEINGITGEVELHTMAGLTEDTFVDRFEADGVDAVFVTGTASSPLVRTMLDEDGVEFLSFDRAEAYAALMSGVTTLVAPQGVLDLPRNIPPEDAHMLGTTTCLVASNHIHRAVAPLLLEVAEASRRDEAAFVTTITFPSQEHVGLPLDPSARRYFSQGTTGLSKFLPYKVTRFLNHLGFMVIPLLTVTVVVLKVVPLALRIWGGLRLKRVLKQLAAVEKGHAAGEDRARLLAELDRIDRATAGMNVPLSVVHDYIDFRQFLHDMRERVAGG